MAASLKLPIFLGCSENVAVIIQMKLKTDLVNYAEEVQVPTDVRGLCFKLHCIYIILLCLLSHHN